jgi:serine-type D-Ala-D-Ala carboxypeptidase (penicillin-binding protein 5/6)
MEWALANFTNASILSAGMKVADAQVMMGMEKSVPLVVNQDLKITMPRMAKADVKAQAVYNGPLEAPVKAGQEVGIIRISIPNAKDIELPITAAKDVPRLGFFPALVEKARRLVMGDLAAASTSAAPAPAP